MANSDLKSNTGTTPGNHSWRATFVVMFISQFLSGVAFSFVMPFFPFYFRELGVEGEHNILLWVGWSSAAFGITMTFSAPLWGILADRVGRKVMVVRSMMAGALVLGLMGLATSPWHVFFLRILQGATTGTVTASVTLVATIVPVQNLGMSLGLLQTAILLGNAVGPFIGGILAEKYGFRLPCGIAFLSLLIGAILVIVFAKEQFVPPQEKKISGIDTIKSILRLKGFPLILVIFFLIYALNTLVTPILPLFIEKLSGKAAGAISTTGYVIGAAGLIAGVSSIFFGRLGDKLGHGIILFLCLVCTGIFSIPQSFAGSVAVLFIERSFFAFASGGIIPAVNVMVKNTIPPEKTGIAYGLTSSVTCLGIGLGPLMGSAIATFTGLRAPFAISGLFSFVVAFFAYKVFLKKS